MSTSHGRERPLPATIVGGRTVSKAGTGGISTDAGDAAHGGDKNEETPKRRAPKSGGTKRAKSNTDAKRAIFERAFNSAVDDIDRNLRRDRLELNAMMDQCWKHVCARKFRNMDMTLAATADLIGRRVRMWVNAAIQARQGDDVDGGENLPLLPRPLRELNNVFAAPQVRENAGRFSFARVAELLNRLPPGSIDAVVQDMPPEFIGELFSYIEKRSRTTRTCGTCEEDKSEWARLSSACRHEMCTQCATMWVKNTMPPEGGQMCPHCAKEGKKHLVDPRLMFGGKGLTSIEGIAPFVSGQLPALQKMSDDAIHLNDMDTDGVAVRPVISRCPNCSTVSVCGNNVIRRCLNPKCAVEFCLQCQCEVEDSVYGRHQDGSCVKIAEETLKIIAGEGLTGCPRCRTMIWHGRGHGCHCVKCTNCGLRFCHSCTTPYDQDLEHLPMCKCPIFCQDEFKCRCARACPECAVRRCEHCSGTCASCIERMSRPSFTASTRNMAPQQ